MNRVIYTNREQLVAFLLALACIFLYILFPAGGTFQKVVSLAGFLVAIPILYIKIILKKSLADFGFQKGNWKRGVGGIIISLGVSLLIFYILINYSDFLKYHQAIGRLKGNFSSFLYYEFVVILPILLAFGVFFQGFILSFAETRLWRLAVLAQYLFFLFFLWISGGFNWDAGLYMICALFAGAVAYQSRSLFYSIAYSWIFVVIADSIAIKLIK